MCSATTSASHMADTRAMYHEVLMRIRCVTVPGGTSHSDHPTPTIVRLTGQLLASIWASHLPRRVQHRGHRSRVTGPLLRCLAGDVEGGADGGPGGTSRTRGGDGLVQFAVGVAEGGAGGDHAAEVDGVARWGGGRVEVVEAVIRSGAVGLHVVNAVAVPGGRQDTADRPGTGSLCGADVDQPSLDLQAGSRTRVVASL